jgi:site-specific DNA recombinase
VSDKIEKARAHAEGVLRSVKARMGVDEAVGTLVGSIRQAGGSLDRDTLADMMPGPKPARLLDALLAVGELNGDVRIEGKSVFLGDAVTADVTGDCARDFSSRFHPDDCECPNCAHKLESAEAELEAIIYGRVSTPEQAEKGYSLAIQSNRLRADAPRYGLRIIGESQDVARGSNMNRPGLLEALAAIGDRRAKALLVTKVDRLTRSTRDLADIMERVHGGAGFVFALEDGADSRTPGGRLRLRQLAAVAEHESERLSERIAATARYKREQGLTTNGMAPFGFSLDGERLVENAVEQEAKRRARALRSDGLSLRGVARELAMMGMLSRRGRPFEAMQIARMLAH